MGGKAQGEGRGEEGGGGSDAKFRYSEWGGTASARKVDFVKELGADEVVDYRSEPSVGRVWEEKGWDGVDVVIDTVGGSTLLGAIEEGVVKEGTRVVSLTAPLSSLGERGKEKEKWLEERGAEFVFFIVKPNGSQLEKLMHGFAGLKGFVEREMGLADGREAMELTEKGTSRGKVVLKI